MRFSALQTKLNEEKVARQKADQVSQEKERQISMLSVDYRQIQQRLQKLEGELRQVIVEFRCAMLNIAYLNSLSIFITGNREGLNLAHAIGSRANEKEYAPIGIKFAKF